MKYHEILNLINLWISQISCNFGSHEISELMKFLISWNFWSHENFLISWIFWILWNSGSYETLDLMKLWIWWNFGSVEILNIMRFLIWQISCNFGFHEILDLMKFLIPWNFESPEVLNLMKLWIPWNFWSHGSLDIVPNCLSRHFVDLTIHIFSIWNFYDMSNVYSKTGFEN